MENLTVAVIIIAVLIAIAGLVLVFWLDRRHHRRVAADRAKEEQAGREHRGHPASERPARLLPKYAVLEITDWGPDFTGKDGTLPRWRWVMFNDFGGIEHRVLMLGNAPTMEAAQSAAEGWAAKEGWIISQTTVSGVEH